MEKDAKMTGPDDDLPMTPELMQFILDEGVRMGHMKLHDNGKYELTEAGIKEYERLSKLHAPVVNDTDNKVN